MKILSTRDLNKQAGIKDWIVEKGQGFFDKIRNVFQESDMVNDENYAEDMINGVKDEQFESQTAEEIMGGSPDYEKVRTDTISGLTKSQKLALQSIETGEAIRIGYLTKDYLTYISRDIMPLYTYRAITTGNNILVSMSYEANDYRAFIINNIVSAQPTESQNFGEEE